MARIQSKELLKDVKRTGYGGSFAPANHKRTFQLLGDCKGEGEAVVDVEVSNDGDNFLVLGSIDLKLSKDVTSDGFASDAPWIHVRGSVKKLSGKDAKVSLLVGSGF
ncbi:MAG: hypothetical protein ACPG5Z_00315 [Pseudoalteromonas sp.]